MVQKALTYKTYAQAKINIFYQLTLVSINLVSLSYLSGLYLESWFSWLGGGMQKTLRKRRKRSEERKERMTRKKNVEYKKSQITTMNMFNFTFYIKRYVLLKNIVWEKVVSAITFYHFIYGFYALQDIWNAVIIHQSIIYINITIII